MKTTFELPDNLYKQAKVYAAIHNLSLKELFNQAISEKLLSDPHNNTKKPWMEFYGKGKSLRDELAKVDTIIESEFEKINPDEWE